MPIVGEAESSKIAGAVSDMDHDGPSRADGNRRSPSERPCIREDETWLVTPQSCGKEFQ